jgi:Trp operon repressor
MFIKREDYQYLEGLCKSLSEAQQERLMTALLGKDRTGSLGERVRIVGEEIYDRQGVEQKDWITRTMIKKAFKDAKQG